MRRITVGLVAALLGLGAPRPVLAKKKRPSPSAEVKKKEKEERPPSSSDKGQNEGAQGRRNATEDAARAADASQFERRP
jgi:hypothetical protein